TSSTRLQGRAEDPFVTFFPPAAVVGATLVSTGVDGDDDIEPWRLDLDDSPPTVTCPPTLKVPQGTPALYEASVEDDGDTTVEYDPPPGLLPTGANTVRVTARDFAGHSASCTFDVLVIPHQCGCGA